MVSALAGLGFPYVAPHKALSLGDLLEVLKLVLGTVAGVGALAALVMNYRKQRLAEVAETREERRMLHEQQRADDDRVRVFNERFTTAAGQLGHDEPAVRLAGVHAMAGLADDWEHGRQTCIDVLCAYLQMPYQPDPGHQASEAERLAFGRNQRVRHSVIAVIASHLRDDARTSWQGHDFDFTGVRFDGGIFRGVRFAGGRISFTGAQFTSGRVSFEDVRFTGGEVSFEDARFIGSQVYFLSALFTGGLVSFDYAKFTGGEVFFTRAEFTGGKVYFNEAEFNGSEVCFNGARFTGSEISYAYAEFNGSEVSYVGAEFTDGAVYFNDAEFTGGKVYFNEAEFNGSEVYFNDARFTGGTVDFRLVDWSNPPKLDSDLEVPPTGLLLPAAVSAANSPPAASV